MNRRTFLLACSIVALGGVAGCGGLTDALFTKANAYDHRDYTETVDYILITTDGKKIIFIGPKYHYIFDAPAHFQEMMASPLHAKMTAQFHGFFVDYNANVRGSITLKIADPDQNDLALMKAYEFSGYQDTTIQLQGTRYAADNFKMPSNLQALNRPYEVSVREELPTQSNKPLVLLTPLTLAADGVLFLFAIPLVIMCQGRALC
jgi:hypothetical protein